LNKALPYLWSSEAGAIQKTDNASVDSLFEGDALGK